MKCFQDDIIIFIGNGLSLAAISNRYSILTATVCKFPIDWAAWNKVSPMKFHRQIYDSWGIWILHACIDVVYYVIT